MKTKLFIAAFLFSMVFTPFHKTYAQPLNWSWAKILGGHGNSSVSSMVTDDSGYVYVTGWFEGTIDINPGPGIYNFNSYPGKKASFILKLNPLGDFIWVRWLRGNGECFANSITTDHTGYLYLTGNFTGYVDFYPGHGSYFLNSIGSTDVFVMKMNTYGQLYWVKQIKGPKHTSSNSIVLEYGNNNIFITGNFKGTVDFDPGGASYNLTSSANSNDVFIAKYSNSGLLIWAKQIGGTGDDNSVSINFENINPAMIYITGNFTNQVDFDPGVNTYFLNAQSSQDIFIVKLFSNSGNFVWAKDIGGPDSQTATSSSIDAFGNIYTTGVFSGATDFDPGAGINNLQAVNSSSDIFICKLNNLGQFRWAKSLGNNGNDIGTGITVDNTGSGEVWTTGCFEDSVDFDPGTGNLFLNSNGQKDIFISRLDSLGNFLWAESKGGNGDDKGTCISVDFSSKVRLAGNFFSQNIWFNHLVFNNKDSAGGKSDSFVAKLGCRAHVTLNLKSCLSYTSPSGLYTWTSSGTYNDTIPAFSGCDSIITFNLIVGQGPSFSAPDIKACYSYLSPSGKYTWTTSGIYTDTIQNYGGCDSIISINLTISTNTTSTVALAACNSYTSPSGKYLWTLTGTYYDTIPTVLGCDSFMTINLTLGKTFSTLFDSSCSKYLSPSGNYFWNISGTYQDTIQNSNGCDSVITFNLIVARFYSTLNDNACSSYISPSGLYTWTSSGSYYDTLTNNSGCDSVITINLTINQSFSNLTISGCNPYISPSGLYSWTTPGFHKDTLMNSAGCDSIMTINLSFLNSASTQNILTCYNYTPPSGNYTWYISGLYHDTITSAFNCDSIITYNVTIKTVNTTVTQNGTVLTGPPIGATFQWLDCNNGFAPIPGAISYQYAPPVDGNYALQVTYTGCVDTSSCYVVTGVGVEEIQSANEFIVFPNPAGDNFTIGLKNYQKPVDITVCDIAGKTIYTLTVTNKRNIEINTRNFADGLYFVKIKTKEFIVTKKLVILK